MKVHVRPSPRWLWLTRVGAAVSLVLYIASKIFGPGTGDIEQHASQPDIIPPPIQQQSQPQDINVDDPVWDWNEKKTEPVRDKRPETRQPAQAARPRIQPGHEPAWVKAALAVAHEKTHPSRQPEDSNRIAPPRRKFQEPLWAKNALQVARKRLEEERERANRQPKSQNRDVLLEEKDEEDDREPMGNQDGETDTQSEDSVVEGENSQDDGGAESNRGSDYSVDGASDGDEEQTGSDSDSGDSENSGAGPLDESDGGNGESDQSGDDNDESNATEDDETQTEDNAVHSNPDGDLNQSGLESGESDNSDADDGGLQDQEASSDDEPNIHQSEMDSADSESGDSDSGDSEADGSESGYQGSGDSEPISADEGEETGDETEGQQDENSQPDDGDSDQPPANEEEAPYSPDKSSTQNRDGDESDMADNGSDMNTYQREALSASNQQPPSEDDSASPNEIEVPVLVAPRRYNVQRLTSLKPRLGKATNPLRLRSRTYVVHRPSSCCTVRDPFPFLSTKRTFGSLFSHRVDPEEQQYDEGSPAPPTRPRSSLSTANQKARLNSVNNRRTSQFAQSDEIGIPPHAATTNGKTRIPRNLPWTPVMYRQPHSKVACTRWWDIPNDPRLKPAEKQTCAMEWGIYDSGKFTLEAGLNESRHVVEAQLREKGREAMHTDPHGLVLMQSARLGNYGPIPGFTNLEAALLPGRSRNDGCDITIPFPAILMQRKPFGFNYYHNLVDGIFATFVHQYAYFNAAKVTADNAEMGMLTPSVEADLKQHPGYELAGAGSVMGLPQMVVAHDGRDVTQNGMGIDKWWNVIWKRGVVNLFKPGLSKDPFETVPSRVCFKGGVLVGGSFDHFWRAQSLMADAQQAFARTIQAHYNVTPAATPDLVTVILRRGSRSIINEAAFIRKLRRQVPAGIRVAILRPESMTLKRTVEILARTKVLVAVHGAGLANMLLLPKGAGVFEIAVGGTVQQRGTGQAHRGLIGWEDHPKYMIGRSHYANLAHRLGMPYAMWVPGEKEIRFDDIQSLVESGNHAFHAHAQVKVLLRKGLTYDMMTSWPPKFRQHPELVHVWVSSQSVWVDPIQASSSLIGYFKLAPENEPMGGDVNDGEIE